MAIKISGSTIIDDSRVVVNADKIGIGTPSPNRDLEILSTNATGIGVSAASAQSTDANKAITVFNAGVTTTFAVSYTGIVTANEYFGTFKGDIDPGVPITNANKIKIKHNSTNDFFNVPFFNSGLSDGDYGEVKYDSSNSLQFNPSLGNLRINSGAGITGLILRTTNNTFDRAIAFQNSGNNYTGYIGMANIGGDDADMVFGVDFTNESVATNVTERLRITNAGITSVKGEDDQDNFIVDVVGTQFAVHTDATDGELSLRAQDGTPNNYSKFMTFFTQASGLAAAERLRITSEGLVGIGQEDPKAGLSIRTLGDYSTPDGNTYWIPEGQWSTVWNHANDILSNRDYWVGFAGGYHTSNNSVNISLAPNRGNFNAQQGMYISGEGTAASTADLAIGKILGGDTLGVSTLASTGKRATKSELFRITAAGNVGIGTDIPSYRLQVQSDGTSTTAAGNIVARFQSFGSGRDATIQLSDNVAHSATISMLSSALIFKQAGAETLRISSSGNVGIGTNDPKSKLDLRGDINYNNNAIIASFDSNGVGGGNIDHIWHSDAPNYGRGGTWNFVSDGTYKATGNSTLQMGFVNCSGGGNFLGNVGIGITSSSTSPLLDVHTTTQGEIVRLRASDNVRYLKISSFNAEFHGSGYDFDATSSGGALSFSVTGNEKLRITKDGDLLRGGANQDIGSASAPWDKVYANEFVGLVNATQQNVTTGNLLVTGIATFQGNVSIAGTLTYEDVTNVDAIGLITARSGIVVTGGNVAINTTTSQYGKLEVNVGSESNSNTEYNGQDFAIAIRANKGENAGDEGNGVVFAQKYFSGDSAIIRTGAILGYKSSGNGNFGGGLIFRTQEHGANPMSEKLRIASDGDLTHTGSDNVEYKMKCGTETGNNIIAFLNSVGVTRGNITYDSDNNFLLFNVNQGEKMRITDGGNVGIGTDIAPHKLSVKGTISKISGTSGIQLVNIANDASSNGTIAINQSGGVERIKLHSAGDSYFKGGSVGIGLTNPNNPLTIHGSGNHIYLKDTATNNILQIRHASGVAEFNSFDLDGSARRDFVFNQYSTEVLRINSAGDLLRGGTGQDIGASGAPWDKVYANEFIGLVNTTQENVTTGNLLVTGISTFVGVATFHAVGIGTDSADSAKLEINVGSAVTALDIQGSEGQLFSVTNNLTTGSIFAVNDVSGTPSINVDADGTIQLAPFLASDKIGIGTTNPAHKLSVIGDAFVSGDLFLTTGDSNADGVVDVVQKISGSGGSLDLYADSSIRLYESDDNRLGITFDVNQTSTDRDVRMYFLGESTTYLHSPASNTLGFKINDNDTLRLADSKVGVNVTDPHCALDVRHSNGNNPLVELHHSNLDTLGEVIRIGRVDVDDIRFHSIKSKHSATASDNNLIIFMHDGTNTGGTGLGQTEAVRIRGNGRVGLGTDNISQRLVVQDSMQLRSSLYNTILFFQRTDIGANGWIGIPEWSPTALYIFGPTSNSNEVAAAYGGGDWTFSAGGTTALRIKNATGTATTAVNIGGDYNQTTRTVKITGDAEVTGTLFANISGTVNPSGDLNIDGSLVFDNTVSKIITDTSDGSDNKAILICGGGDTATSRGALAIFYGNELNSGRLDFYSGVGGGDITFNTGTTTTERLRIRSNGFVGINTNTPGKPLDVHGNVQIGSKSNADAELVIGRDDSGNRNAYIDLIGDDTYDDYGLRMIRKDQGPNTESQIAHRGTGPLSLVTQDGGDIVLATSSLERVRINDDGRIQIGTLAGNPITLTQDDEYAVHLTTDIRNSNADDVYALRIDIDDDDDVANVTGDRARGSAYFRFDGNSDQGDTSDELQIFNIFSDVNVNTDYDLVRGIYSDVSTHHSDGGGTISNSFAVYGDNKHEDTGAISNVYGAFFYARANGSSATGTISNLYGLRAIARHAGSNTGNTGSMIGVRGEVQIRESTATRRTAGNVYSFYADLHNDNIDTPSTVVTGRKAMYFGDVSGTTNVSGLGRIYGLYLQDATDNYLSGNLQVVGVATVTTLNATTVNASNITGTISGAVSNVTVDYTGRSAPCSLPITVSEPSTGTKQINIPSSSNAFGAKYVQTTEPTGSSVCEGDIWYDTSTESDTTTTNIVEATKFFQNPTQLTETTIFPASGTKNGGAFGPYEIASGVTFTINSGSTFTIL